MSLLLHKPRLQASVPFKACPTRVNSGEKELLCANMEQC